MTETVTNDPFAWFKKLESIDSDTAPSEEKALLEKVLPEEERGEFDAAGVFYFLDNDETAIAQGLKEFGGQEKYEAFVHTLGSLTLTEQFDLVATLATRQKVAAFQIAIRQLHPDKE